MPKKSAAKRALAKVRASGAKPGRHPTHQTDIEQFAILRAGGMAATEAVRLIRAAQGERPSPKSIRERALEWTKKTAARVEELRLASARACELSCGITKASQVAFYQEIRDCVVAKENPQKSRLIEKIKVTTRTLKDGSQEQTMEFWIPSKLGAAKRIDDLLGFDLSLPTEAEAPAEVEASGEMTLADFMHMYHRPGLAIVHRSDDVAQGKLIELPQAEAVTVDQSGGNASNAGAVTDDSE